MIGVYVLNTVMHMISGHAYACAPRAHLLTSAALEEAVTQLTVDNLMNDIPGQSHTGKLWMEYIRQVRVLLLFIRADGKLGPTLVHVGLCRI